MVKTGRRRWPSPAIVVAVLALLAALVGTAVAGPGAGTSAITKAKVKKVAKKQINKRLPWETGDIADAAVTAPKIADGAVTSGKFFLSVVQNHDFGLVEASNCTGRPGQSPTLLIPAPGITATDHVLVTPPPGFADTFVLTAVPDPANNQVVVSACNNFFAGSGDPDAGGGPYKILVIR
jgi:hypothetical protein